MKKECWNCMGGQGDTDGVGCADCRAGDPPSNWRTGPNYVPDTNADRIRAMSDEELADQLVIKFDGLEECSVYISPPTGKLFISREAAVRVTLEWLWQQVEED